MSATNHTQNYDLSQFVGGDIPSWLGDYNGDMGKIDAAIAEVATGAGTAASEINSLKSRMTAAEADIDADEANITQLQTTTSSQGASISTNTTNIASLDTRVTALENAGGSDFDLTAHKGTATVTPESGVTLYDDITYALNDEGTIGKIYGSLNASFTNLAQGDTKLATIAVPNMMTLSQAHEIVIGEIGVFIASTGALDSNVALILNFTANKTVEVIIRAASARTQTYALAISLPPVLYFISQGC